LHSEKDSQLYNALAKRNQLKENVILITFEYIKARLSKQDLGSGDSQKMISLLDQAESFTGKQQLLNEIAGLREQLVSIQ